MVNRYRVNRVLAGQRRSIDVTGMQVKTATEIVKSLLNLRHTEKFNFWVARGVVCPLLLLTCAVRFAFSRFTGSSRVLEMHIGYVHHDLSKERNWV